MAFCLNPYDVTLDLRNKDDRKIYLDGCKGLDKEDLFDGSKEKYKDFVKLMKKPMEDVRVMKTLMVPTKWDEHNADNEQKKCVLPGESINIFDRHSASKEQVRTYVDLFWANTAHGINTPKYHGVYATAPNDDATLNAGRNGTKLKSVMLGKKLWGSLTSAYKKEITGRCSEFTMGGDEGEYDGVLLWDFLRRTIKPSTKVGASKLKETLEKCDLNSHEQNILKFNSWFEDTRLEIIAEEGEGYNEYLRQLFRAYLTSNSPEFIATIKSEQRDWIQGKLADDYTHKDLLSVGRLAYNNLVDEEKVTKKELAKSPHFLALAAQLIETMTSDKQGSSGGNSKGDDKDNGKTRGPRTFLPWRYENPNNEKVKEVKETTMTWCTNDCHDKPMWCGRPNCLNRSDYAANMKKQREGNSGGEAKPGKPSGGKFSEDFKIALAAMIPSADFESLENQFMTSN